jgi:rifampicin phosphotransferase
MKTTDTQIVQLDGLTAGQEPLAGAKAYNCARLKQAGFRVPDGLVVLSAANKHEIANLAEHPWFKVVPADEKFAVRSSGIGEDSEGESFAGIHQTLLNVAREDVAAAVRACRESALSGQALEYRRAKGIPTDDVRMAVLIQRMLQPRVAGVAFTINPLSGNTDEIVINASWGLGEALVSGQVDPDEFAVSKRSGMVLHSLIGAKNGMNATTASLTPVQLRELVAVLKSVEEHYGTPQDVEWCHDGSAFWIVQSRPVTTRWAVRGDIEWTRANIAEVLPDLTCPQALAAFEDILNRAERQALGRLIAPDAELGPMLKSFCGRLHFNLSQLRHMCRMTGVPAASLLRSMGHPAAIGPEDELAKRPPLAVLACIPDLLRIVTRHLTAARVVRRHQSRTREYLTRIFAIDPKRLPDLELWSELDLWLHDSADFMQTVLLLGGVMFHEEPVRKACAKAAYPFEKLLYSQLAAGERSVSAQQAYDLVALAEVARNEPQVSDLLRQPELPEWPRLREALSGSAFLRDFKIFLQKYGHRGQYEYDWSLPRYAEDPTPLLHAVRAHLQPGAGMESSNSAEAAERQARETLAEFEQRLSPWQKRILLPSVKRSLRMAKSYYIWREQVRSDLVRITGIVRAWHLVMAQRFVERGWIQRQDDYFLLLLPEIAAVLVGQQPATSLNGIASRRKAELDRFRALEMPLLMRHSELPQLIRAARMRGAAEDYTELTGQPVSSGCVEAEVVVVRAPGDFGNMKRGAILVAPATDPSWTPLFTLASGVIVEVGGILSHASTIAREYGLPAIANVRHATRRLRTGERVRLDAVTGVIERLEVPTPAAADMSASDGASAATARHGVGTAPYEERQAPVNLQLS